MQFTGYLLRITSLSIMTKGLMSQRYVIFLLTKLFMDNVCLFLCLAVDTYIINGVCISIELMILIFMIFSYRRTLRFIGKYINRIFCSVVTYGHDNCMSMRPNITYPPF